MKRLAFILCLALVCSRPALATSEASPRLIVHLLDYIAMDYAGAVRDGKVLSRSEYQEQCEFIQSAVETAESIPEIQRVVEIGAEMNQLRQLILTKASAEDVRTLARSVEAKIIHAASISVAPEIWPSLARGGKLYAENCAICHGVSGKGDGAAGVALDPRPPDFQGEKMEKVPPFQAFNAIRLGVPGTPMPAFETLSDDEVWNLAFFVLSLRHQNQAAALAALSLPKEVSLKDLATLSDSEIRKKLTGSEPAKDQQIARLRLASPEENDSGSFIAFAKSQLREAEKLAGAGDFVSARKRALMAYLDGVEPIEPRLRAKDPSFTAVLEQKMALVRSAIEAHDRIDAIGLRVQDANESLEQADVILQQSESSPWFTFSIAAGIFLREGFEAALIVITLLGVLRSLGSRRAMLMVHAGWGLAVFLGIGCWFFSGWLMGISGAQREILEGGISALAVVVLLYLGFWLHRKTEIGKWKAFIAEMVRTATEERNLWALAGIAFMAVFREAFETVLFLRALLLEAGPHQQLAVVAGVGMSFLLVLALASAIVRYSARVPVRQLFIISSWVMVFLAFILVGKAVHSFQEAGWLSVTATPLNFRWDLVGFYPTYETLLPQLGILVLCLVLWIGGRRPSPVSA